MKARQLREKFAGRSMTSSNGRGGGGGGGAGERGYAGHSHSGVTPSNNWGRGGNGYQVPAPFLDPFKPVIPNPFLNIGHSDPGFRYFGGGGGGSGNSETGYQGGSGIVVVRYKIGSVQAPGSSPKGATGGSITQYNDKVIHTFTKTGTFSTPGPFSETCEYVIVAGGGGGGNSGNMDRGGGGGGGGGFKTGSTPVGGPLSLTVTIGSGGRGGQRSNNSNGVAGTPSSVNFPGGTVTSTGGGYGGRRYAIDSDSDSSSDEEDGRSRRSSRKVGRDPSVYGHVDVYDNNDGHDDGRSRRTSTSSSSMESSATPKETEIPKQNEILDESTTLRMKDSSTENPLEIGESTTTIYLSSAYRVGSMGMG